MIDRIIIIANNNPPKTVTLRRTTRIRFVDVVSFDFVLKYIDYQYVLPFTHNLSPPLSVSIIDYTSSDCADG